MTCKSDLQIQRNGFFFFCSSFVSSFVSIFVSARDEKEKCWILFQSPLLSCPVDWIANFYSLALLFFFFIFHFTWPLVSWSTRFVCSLQFVVCSLQFAVCSLKSKVYSLQFTVYSLQWAVVMSVETLALPFKTKRKKGKSVLPRSYN